ncbi:hypothetical protein ACWEOV_03935 [Streptomyces sp. NPDC004365]
MRTAPFSSFVARRRNSRAAPVDAAQEKADRGPPGRSVSGAEP